MINMRGSGIYADIAIDSISVTSCECGSNEAHHYGLVRTFSTTSSCDYALMRGIELNSQALKDSRLIGVDTIYSPPI